MQAGNVIQFIPKAVQEKADLWATQAVSNALSSDLELNNEALSGVLQGVTKVVYFSGDIEEGESRQARIVEGNQLLRAASSQLYTYEVFEQHIRIEFDGEYIYYLYLDELHTSANIIVILKKMLEASQEIRRSQFDNFANSLFGVAAL